MRLQDLAERRLTFWGVGREGESALRHFHRLVPDTACTILTDTPLPQERRTALLQCHATLQFRSGADTADTLAQSEVVLKSPGISLYRPELAQARRQNPALQLGSVTRLWFAEPGAAERCIVVSGTKGKSTIAALLHHCLQGLGVPARLGGNIGVPLLDVNVEEEGLVIAELSSHQAADLEARPRIGVLSNLYPAHIDWHGSTEQYYRDKLRLFAPGSAQKVLLNRADPNTRRLCAQWPHADWYRTESGFDARDGAIFHAGERWGAPPGERLGDSHNLDNVCAVLSAVEALDGDCRRAFAAMEDYPGLPHRLQFLGRRAGVAYIDDSIATVPEAAAAALHHCRRCYGGDISVLLGGSRHTQSYRAFARTLDAFPECTAITMGDNGAEIFATLRDWREEGGGAWHLLQGGTLEEALALARQHTPAGGVILLSPAAPSYGQFADFAERGRAFGRAAGFDAN